MRRFKVPILLGAVAILSLLTLACGPTTSSSQSSGDDTTTPVPTPHADAPSDQDDSSNDPTLPTRDRDARLPAPDAGMSRGWQTAPASGRNTGVASFEQVRRSARGSIPYPQRCNLEPGPSSTGGGFLVVNPTFPRKRESTGLSATSHTT